MNTPSRSPNASVRTKRPHRPLPSLPPVHDAKKEMPRLPLLVKDDVNEPFQLLEAHPLSLICQYHNVKHVSLEEGVPPPFKFDVPILRGASETPNALLPTHVLAVYDQDGSAERSEPSPALSPHTPGTSSARLSLPATPIMIPVNAELWALHFTSALSADHIPASSPSFLGIGTLRQHSRTDSMTSSSSQRSSGSSFSQMRPRSILSLPVHVVRVPSAKALPLLLLATLGILPKNRVIPALLPRKVLAELPAPPTILAQQLLHWLYPTPENWRTRSLDDNLVRTPSFGSFPLPSVPMTSRSPRLPLPPSPLLSPSPNSGADALNRLSATSGFSLPSTNSSISSFHSSAPVASPYSDTAHEPICVLSDPATADDPDLRLLALTQQNFGVWTDALALGVRDSGVVRLVELAWSVASEARRLRFGDPTSLFASTSVSASGSDFGGSEADDGKRSANSSLRSRQGRTQARAPIPPFLNLTPIPPSSPK